jgi:hypothetical protein
VQVLPRLHTGLIRNINLVRRPKMEDYFVVLDLVSERCECTDEMIAQLEHGDEEICKPCAARQVINGLTSLADSL